MGPVQRTEEEVEGSSGELVAGCGWGCLCPSTEIAREQLGTNEDRLARWHSKALWLRLASITGAINLLGCCGVAARTCRARFRGCLPPRLQVLPLGPTYPAKCCCLGP